MNLALGIKLEVQDNHGASYVGQNMIKQYGQPQRTVEIVIKPEMPCVRLEIGSIYGIILKIKAADLVCGVGIPMMIVNGTDPTVLYDVLEGTARGSFFAAIRQER